MAQTKIEQGLLKFTEATDYLKIPTGTTAQRPSSPANGYIRFNTTINDVEAYNGTEWTRMGIAPPSFSSVDYPGSATALDPAGGESLVINGSTFNSGITVTIGGTSASSVTVNSSAQITVTTPAKSAGTYDIVFTNTDGGTATATNAVSYNGLPAFTNAAGSLGSVEEDSTVNLSAAATEPDGGAITYAITSGSLPSGLSLNSSTGAITGTAPSVSADTTSSFTVTATDNENQTASRAYSITVTNIAPSGNFNTVLYTGNGTTQSITGVGFQPDFVWLKRRNGTQGHRLIDSTTGADKYLESSSTSGQQGAGSAGLTSFDSDGFSLGSGAAHNINTGTFVAWCWKLNGGTTSSNTDGSITSTVQVNQNLGFSIATYTGTGATASVGHGLGQKPDFVVIKQTTSASAWVVFSDATGTFSFSYLNLTNAFSAYAPMSWDSSVLNLNGGTDQNRLNDTHVAYFFTSKQGFSKIGSYTGNGSTDGPIVETGFEPAFVMGKRTDTADNWWILDNKRNTSNPRNTGLFPNLTSADLTGGYSVNFLSNGFQVNTTNAALNASGGTYIYMAFAADPDTTAPTLANSFDALTWSGQNSSLTINNGFKTGLLWTRARTVGHHWGGFDIVRGPGKWILPNDTSAELSGNYGIEEFLDTSTKLYGSTSPSNAASNTYVGFFWKADDALPTINTDGSITSLVSANANAGLSIVKWKGSGAAGTIGHGLSAAPELIITKNLDTTNDWWTYNKDLNGGTNPASYFIKLNSSDAEILNSSGSLFQGTSPTSTVFSIGTSLASNNFIAYCFHSVSGFSNIGEYQGNGNATGPTITTGFQPDFVMIKNRSAINDWLIYDSVRGGTIKVSPNTSSAEATVNGVNFLATGFSINGTDGALNAGTSNYYIYAAFKIN